MCTFKSPFFFTFLFPAGIISLVQSIFKPVVVKVMSYLQRQAQLRIDDDVNFQHLFPSTPKSNLKWVMHQRVHEAFVHLAVTQRSCLFDFVHGMCVNGKTNKNSIRQ